MDLRESQRSIMVKGATSITKWVGSTASVLLHTILFLISFVLPYMGFVTFERMLLVLTTIVSLEAIYLSIFIQMSINMNNENLEIIQEDIVELGEDIEEIGEDIEEIGEGIEEIGTDIEELGEDIEEIGEGIEEIGTDIEELGEDIEEIGEDIEEIQKDADDKLEETEDIVETPVKADIALLSAMQATLLQLQRDIEQLKNSRKNEI